MLWICSGSQNYLHHVIELSCAGLRRSPPNHCHNHSLTLNSGYMNVVGYISIYASTIYGATLILVAACSIGSDSTWASTKYSNYGIYAATTVLTFCMTCVSSKVLTQLNTFYIFLQFAVMLGLIVALAAATPSEYKNSASFVFADFENTGFWPDK
jgi:hypothetical protein